MILLKTLISRFDRFFQRPDGDDVNGHSHGNRKQQRPEPSAGDCAADGPTDGQPQQNECHHLLPDRDSPAFAIIPYVLAAQAICHKPVIEPIGTSGITGSRQEQEWCCRKHRQEDSCDSEPDTECSAADQ